METQQQLIWTVTKATDDIQYRETYYDLHGLFSDEDEAKEFVGNWTCEEEMHELDVCTCKMIIGHMTMDVLI